MAPVSASPRIVWNDINTELTVKEDYQLEQHHPNAVTQGDRPPQQKARQTDRIGRVLRDR
jgi:hypothetical protein